MRKSFIVAGTLLCALALEWQAAGPDVPVSLPGTAAEAAAAAAGSDHRNADGETLTSVSVDNPVYGEPAAQNVTTRVSGTVEQGTSNVMLYLKTTDGTMQIRLDSNTDTSECRMLIVGAAVTADVYRGDDAVMHASKLMSGTVASVSVDTSKETQVSGTVASGTTESMLLLDTAQGTMKIRIDSTTNLSGAGVLYQGKPLSVVVARGDDAYMHAVSIEAKVATQESSHPGAVPVTGTVTGGTNLSMLYLKTGDGTMKIKIDSDTDTSAGRVLVTGNNVTAYVYRGSDAYMHAAKIVGRADIISSDSVTTVKGAVSEGTTTDVIHLLTEQGVMYIRIDSTTDMSACGVVLEGQYLYIDVVRGNDAYMHALRIVNPDYTPSASGQSSSGSAGSGSAAVTHADAREVTGGPTDQSSDDLMYLSTSEGTFQIKLDSSTQMASKGFMTGHTTKVTIYRGSDGYYHAEKVVDDQFQNNKADVGSTTYTVRGTIAGDSSLNQLNLNSSDGQYKLKIDSTTEMSNIRYLKAGRSVEVTFANGNDGYLHAVKIAP